jgi:hypothetical protein
MATQKDLNTNENTGRNKRAQEDWESHHTTNDRYPEEAKGIAETEVKNAHAAGDGTLGPNDTPLPDEDRNKGRDQYEEPPY